MFRTEGSELVKGSMLALTIEAILDFAGERSGNFRMIECEVSSHDAYGTPRDLFVAFFGVIAATLARAARRRLVGRDRCGVAGHCLPRSKASSREATLDAQSPPSRLQHRQAVAGTLRL